MENPSTAASGARKRHLTFFAAWILSLIVFWGPLSALVKLSLDDYRYSQIVLIPFISACLIYLKRTNIFAGERWFPRLGIPLLALGAALYVVGRSPLISQGSSLSLFVLAIVVIWTAEFVWCYGPQASKAALFPLLFLLLFVPIPSGLLDVIIVMLQRGSTEITQWLYWVVGMPAYREGFQFSLPGGLTIEVAKECSSIRSGTALFITGLLAGYAFIRSPWRRACLAALTVPIAMFTDGVRIVILTWLTVHVDRGYLYGSLHHEGGALFSLISVVALIIAIVLLSEDKLHWRRSARRV